MDWKPFVSWPSLRGSFIALTFCTGWLLLSALAGSITQ